MPLKIEDYALIADLQTCALVGRDGSIDWLCVPRFDSEACFAALLGTSEHGRWLIAPRGEIRTVRRRYRGDSLILETEFECDSGRVRLIDFMPMEWLVHSVAGRPEELQIMYGVAGERRLTEFEVTWLPGYEGSRPVRIGNAPPTINISSTCTARSWTSCI